MTFQVVVIKKPFSILIYVFGNVATLTKNNLHLCSFGKWLFLTWNVGFKNAVQVKRGVVVKMKIRRNLVTERETSCFQVFVERCVLKKLRVVKMEMIQKGSTFRWTLFLSKICPSKNGNWTKISHLK
jgi:hypothetical protein